MRDPRNRYRIPVGLLLALAVVWFLCWLAGMTGEM